MINTKISTLEQAVSVCIEVVVCVCEVVYVPEFVYLRPQVVVVALVRGRGRDDVHRRLPRPSKRLGVRLK